MSQRELKKRFNFGKRVKSCATCRHSESFSNEIASGLGCRKTGIVIEADEVTSMGNESLISVCDAWQKGRE